MYSDSDIQEYISSERVLRWYQFDPQDARELIIKMALFLLCPFAAFLGSLLRPTSKSSFIVYFLFGILFCWHMDPAGLLEYDDYIGIKDDFLRNKYTMAIFYEKLVDFITFQGKEKEMYSVFLNAVTRQFSNNFHLFFAIASVPYLTFSLLSVRKLSADSKFPLYGLMPLMLILVFVIPRDIVTVQNPRYTTGVWLSMWGFLNYFDRTQVNGRLYLIPIFLTPFVHSGFWPMLMVFALAMCMPISGHVKTLHILFFASIPFSLLSYELFTGINFSFLPTSMAHWVESYLSDDAYANFINHKGTSGFFWVTQMFSYINYAIYLVIPIMLMKRSDEIMKRADIGVLYPFYILLFSVINFIRLLPVIGVRYFLTIQIMSVYMFFKVFYPERKKFVYVLMGAWVFYIFMRWFYSGAGLRLVPKNIYYDNLISLIGEYVGV